MAEVKQNVIVVKLGQIAWSDRPEDLLVTYSLGSCVGLVLWDPVERVGGMAHVFLPSSNGRNVSRPEEAPRFADIGIPLLIQRMERKGASRRRLVARMAGGASLFPGLFKEMPDIGAQNVSAVVEILRKHSIPIVGSDVGGNYGRTMRLEIRTGRTTVATAFGVEREI
ncbi:MAG TPA: chemotaxis protein CheD [Firmicutes bacterium]|nr:chemotaxis protein CheD [Candidatus Fermentithermobacillaceae bacterium]